MPATWVPWPFPSWDDSPAMKLAPMEARPVQDVPGQPCSRLGEEDEMICVTGDIPPKSLWAVLMPVSIM